nr:EAL domain-containing protein [Trichormus azollae]
MHSFPFDNLKIDRSSIHHLHEESDNLGLVNAIVQTVKIIINMHIIAEGIETHNQLDQLKLLNCQFGQGYLFCKPLDSEKSPKFILDISEFKLNSEQ